MKYTPQCPELQQHIDHYWIVKDVATVFHQTPPVYAYPGITPELILVLDGYYTSHYQGKTEKIHHSKLYSFLSHDIILDLSTLRSFIIVQFKSRALSSLLPFVNQKADELMRQPICKIADINGPGINKFCQYLQQLSSEEAVNHLDEWLRTMQHSKHTGFLAELANDLPAYCTPAALRQLTGYSYSTLERHFKRDTGLSPKAYQSLQRYKLAVQEIYQTRNEDWHHYVHRYGYYDQSHFIKEIKRYTSFTPQQLLHTPGLLSFRP